MNSEPDNKLTLEWVKGADGMALVFDPKTWKTFQDAAKMRDTNAEHIIVAAVAGCLGPILMDNYTLNRFLRP
jgi:hypothetical protein